MVSNQVRTLAVDVPVSETPRRRAWPRFLTSEHPFLWLAPITALILAFGVYPLLYALWLSLFKRNPITRLNVFNPTWNWGKLFADERVWGAIGHTYLYTVTALGIELCLGLAIALLLDSDRKGYGVLRALMSDVPGSGLGPKRDHSDERHESDGCRECG